MFDYSLIAKIAFIVLGSLSSIVNLMVVNDIWDARYCKMPMTGVYPFLISSITLFIYSLTLDDPLLIIVFGISLFINTLWLALLIAFRNNDAFTKFKDNPTDIKSNVLSILKQLEWNFCDITNQKVSDEIYNSVCDKVYEDDTGRKIDDEIDDVINSGRASNVQEARQYLYSEQTRFNPEFGPKAINHYVAKLIQIGKQTDLYDYMFSEFTKNQDPEIVNEIFNNTIDNMVLHSTDEGLINSGDPKNYIIKFCRPQFAAKFFRGLIIEEVLGN